MITLKLDQHSGAAVYVELDQEYGAAVDLSFEHEKYEFGRWTPLKTTTDAEHADLTAIYPNGDDAETLREQLRRACTLRDAYKAELRRAVEQLEQAGGRTLDRKLLPDEARELAAMLVHYAERAEAPK